MRDAYESAARSLDRHVGRDLSSIGRFLRHAELGYKALTTFVFPSLLAIGIAMLDIRGLVASTRDTDPFTWIGLFIVGLALLAQAGSIFVLSWIRPSVTELGSLGDARAAIDRFWSVADAKVKKAEDELEAFKNSSAAYATLLGALREPHAPLDKEIGNPTPWSKAAELDVESSFKLIAEQSMSPFRMETILRVLGGTSVPPCFCISLFYPTRNESGSVRYYGLLVRDGTEDYAARRSTHATGSRVWPPDHQVITQIGADDSPLIIDDLQDLDSQRVLIAEQKRAWDKDLYRGALLVRSTWSASPYGPDPVGEGRPAFVLILTSSKPGAFEACRDNHSAELIVEALRDYLDTVLLACTSIAKGKSRLE